ncbi:hypothetical protein [Deinococcus aquaedulcis]|uniref:hypothetical protein n=1 Tax=Deinococcus aquaedulcis TaxID=2840455 RepID=UPI001C83B430|nr:hypothetical protein [Deinococcus aquaedulcis]
MHPEIAATLDAILKAHGTVPPLWTAYPHLHPYSIGWRMGAGELYKMAWSKWWRQQVWTEEQRLTYVRAYPFRAAWLGHVISLLWGISIHDPEVEVQPYFEAAQRLGFASRAEFEADLKAQDWGMRRSLP